jgi:MFS transporter, PPP family, 3-phenylpropionic acid transporter
MTRLTHSQTNPLVFKLNFFFFFAGMGVILPRISIYLIEERALASAGVILALTQFSAPMGALVSGIISDSTMLVRRIALPCGFLLTIILFGLSAFDPVSTPVLLFCFTLFSFLTGAIIPLTSVSYLQSGNKAELFGKVRLYGSIGFCLINLLLVFFPFEFQTLFGMSGFFFLINFFCQLFLPQRRAILDRNPDLSFKSQLKMTFASSRYVLFISFVFFFFFIFSVQKFLVSARIARDMVHSDFDYNSLFWSIGTFLEALFFYYSPIILKVVSASGLFFSAFLLTLIRYALSIVYWDEAIYFISAQILHGLQFGSLYLGSILMLQKNVPGKVLGTAQAGMAVIGRSMGGALGVYFFTGLLSDSGYFSLFTHAFTLCLFISLLALIFHIFERKKESGWIGT